MIHFFNYWKKRISELFNTKMVYSYKDICGTSVSVCQKKKKKKKYLGNAFIFFCSCLSILWKRSITSFSLSFLELRLPIFSVLLLFVANIAMSQLLQSSVLYCFFGHGRLTVPFQAEVVNPSNNQISTPSHVLQYYHFYLIHTNLGILIISWIEKMI